MVAAAPAPAGSPGSEKGQQGRPSGSDKGSQHTPAQEQPAQHVVEALSDAGISMEAVLRKLSAGAEALGG